ncbi:hypothetical protein [Breznakia pachnodae]|uniref:Uncharacterized protein n=1 Tax=Breznakia pachnodae TaxID=265178 RepID=A0ABU0E755_9FIRM|nr:hypothetical protein [Breznakia pachnodae]MDQ0362539.1 hypothetical protein [Breznakia pachnodae]
MTVVAILFRKNGNIATFLTWSEKQEIPIVMDDQKIKKLKRGGVYKLEKTGEDYRLVDK